MQRTLKNGLYKLLCVGGMCLLAASGLYAASLQVTPTLMQFLPNQRAQVLEVENSANVPILVQARVLRWRQKDGVESLEPDDTLIISPNLIRLAGASKQRLRIILNATDVKHRTDEAYRILIDEIPVSSSNTKLIKLALRYSIPLFFVPSDAAPEWQLEDLRWSLDTSTAAPQLKVKNLSTFPAQLADAFLQTADQQEISLTKGLMGYAFSGSSHQWTLSDLATSQYQSVRSISVQVNGQRKTWPIQFNMGKE